MKGFAYTLGLTTIIDVVVVILFTHPMLQLLAQTRFFSSGNPWSGLDPNALGAVYRGRAEFRKPSPLPARKAARAEEAQRRQTIAERKAAELGSGRIRSNEGRSRDGPPRPRLRQRPLHGQALVQLRRRAASGSASPRCSCSSPSPCPSSAAVVTRAGFNLGIEFRGGSQFLVEDAQTQDDGTIDTELATVAVHDVVPTAVVHVATVGDTGVRVQTDQLTTLDNFEPSLRTSRRRTPPRRSTCRSSAPYPR